jgi:hypothetical protein
MAAMKVRVRQSYVRGEYGSPKGAELHHDVAVGGHELLKVGRFPLHSVLALGVDRRTIRTLI